MGLTNAERQKRYRQKLIKLARSAPSVGLSPDQIADRDAVMAEPIWPVPAQGLRGEMPTFMGWTRYEWSEAPMPLIEFFGMQEAREGWDAEWRAMNAKMGQG